MNEDGLLTVEIDKIKTSVPEGTTVLQAAKSLGIYIPTLCSHEALSMYASCRVCIVEMGIERGGKLKTWIDASCAYPVQEGLIVRTNSPQVQKERKLIIELLLSRAPNSEILNNLADRYGAKKGRFDTIDKGESNCILCGLCVRTCNELIHSGGIGTAFRGIHKKVVTPFKVAQDLCIGCAACAYVCPTGAIKVIEDGKSLSIENWYANLEMKYCKECGKPIGPKVYIERIMHEVPVREDIIDICPSCRRKVLKVK